MNPKLSSGKAKACKGCRSGDHTHFIPVSSVEEKCICLEDNKMIQALCPVHNPVEEVKEKVGGNSAAPVDLVSNWESEFDKLLDECFSGDSKKLKYFTWKFKEHALKDFIVKLLQDQEKRIIKEQRKEITKFIGKPITMEEARKATNNKNVIYLQGYKGGYNALRKRVKRHNVDLLRKENKE